MKKTFSLSAFLIFVIAGLVIGQPAEITVQCVEGLKNWESDTLKAGSQITFEFTHLLKKLNIRDPLRYKEIRYCRHIEVHRLFRYIPGEVEDWEK